MNCLMTQLAGNAFFCAPHFNFVFHLWPGGERMAALPRWRRRLVTKAGRHALCCAWYASRACFVGWV